MNELETIKRKIILKRQALAIIRGDLQRFKLEADLLKLRLHFEKQIDHTEDQKALSRYLDMTEALLQALREDFR